MKRGPQTGVPDTQRVHSFYAFFRRTSSDGTALIGIRHGSTDAPNTDEDVESACKAHRTRLRVRGARKTCVTRWDYSPLVVATVTGTSASSSTAWATVPNRNFPLGERR